jgi:hypothetical protein
MACLTDDTKELPATCPNCGTTLKPSPLIPNAGRCEKCGILIEVAGDATLGDDTPTLEKPKSS